MFNLFLFVLFGGYAAFIIFLAALQFYIYLKHHKGE